MNDRTQLTTRAVLIGMLLGGLMSLSNLYVALKTGWSFGVSSSRMASGCCLPGT